MELVSIIDAMACAVIGWVSGAFLLHGRGDCTRSILFNLGLLMLAVAMVALALLPLSGAGLALWSLWIARIGGAIVAIGIYERRLGWASQARVLRDALVARAAALRARWVRIRSRRSRTRLRDV